MRSSAVGGCPSLDSVLRGLTLPGRQKDRETEIERQRDRQTGRGEDIRAIYYVDDGTGVLGSF